MTIEVFCCRLGGVKEPYAVDEVPYHKDCPYVDEDDDSDDDVAADDDADNHDEADDANDDDDGGNDGDAHDGDINANVIVDDEVLVLVGPGLKLQLYHPQAFCC